MDKRKVLFGFSLVLKKDHTKVVKRFKGSFTYREAKEMSLKVGELHPEFDLLAIPDEWKCQ